jgi:hypothetical protein
MRLLTLLVMQLVMMGLLTCTPAQRYSAYVQACQSNGYVPFDHATYMSYRFDVTQPYCYSGDHWIK